METLEILNKKNRKEQYENLLPQWEQLMDSEVDLIANQANLAAILKAAFGFFWVGFYRSMGNELVLGPFQGPLACTRIKLGKGVCGTVAEKRETLIVPDVDAFPGHISCSSESRSEIVLPLIQEGQLLGVLDIDSDQLDDFDQTDAHYLSLMLKVLLKTKS